MRCNRLLSPLLLLALLLVGLTAVPSPSATATTGDIAGLVQDAAKQPIANAVVRISAGPMLLTARTGTDGKYTLSDLVPGSYELNGQKPGYNSVHKSNVSVAVNATTTLNFTLTWGNAAAAGADVVVHTPAGKALAGADVALFTNGLLIDHITTDEVGSAVFPGLTPGYYNAQVQRPGYKGRTTSSVRLRAGGITTLNVTLNADPNQVGRLGGVVQNPDIQTLRKVEVKVLAGLTKTTDTTNNFGQYMLTNLVPGTYSVQYSLAGYQTQVLSNIQVGASATTQVDVTLIPVQAQKGSISGKVLDAQGLAVQFATVRITAGPAAGDSVLTAQDGSFTFTDLTPSTDYALTAEQAGYSPAGVSAIKVFKGQTTVVNFQLLNQTLPAGSITGTVRDASSSVVLSGVRVDILQGPSAGLTTTTDDSGEYLLEGLIPSQVYTLRFSKTGYLVNTYPLLTVTAGLRTTKDATLTAQVASVGNISGVVTRASNGAVVAGATVNLYQGPSSPLSATTSSTGAYSFKNLRPGSGYGIKVSKTGFTTATHNAITVSTGGTTTVNFSLKGSGQVGSIHGTAVNLALQPVTNATVRLSGGPTQADPVGTSVNGDFTFSGLAPGTYSVQITAPTHPTTTQSGVVVTPGRTTEVLFHFNE